MIKEENSLGKHWSRLQGLFELKDMHKVFRDLMRRKGFMRLESIQRVYELHDWIIKCIDCKIIMFHDSDDGLYDYVYNGTKGELTELMKEVCDYTKEAAKACEKNKQTIDIDTDIVDKVFAIADANPSKNPVLLEEATEHINKKFVELLE